jgi:tRNA modification GTPase
LDALKELLEQWFAGEARCDGSLLTNARQFGALTRAQKAVERAGRSLHLTPDAVLTDVEEAMAALGEVIGRTVREDITNRIFERFCVGK